MAAGAHDVEIMTRAFFSLGVIVSDPEGVRLRILQFIKNLSILVGALRKRGVLLRRDRSRRLPQARRDKTDRYERKTNWADFERPGNTGHGLSTPFPAGASRRAWIVTSSWPPLPGFTNASFRRPSG